MPRVLAESARRDRIHAVLTSLPSIDCLVPSAGWSCSPSLAKPLRRNTQGLRSTAALAAWLLEPAHVVVVSNRVERVAVTDCLMDSRTHSGLGRRLRVA